LFTACTLIWRGTISQVS